MDDSALREALRKLLAQGSAAEDNKLLKMSAAKNAPVVAPEMCPECEVPLEEGKCAKCGYSAPVDGADDGELAGLLEQGAAQE